MRALLVAAALTVTIPSVASPAAERTFPCWMVRLYVKHHSRAEVERKADEYKATPRERARAIACLKEKK